MARAFQFRLATVMRVRELREREALRCVAAKRAEIARLDQLDEDARREVAACLARLSATQQQSRLDPDEIARARSWIAHLRRVAAQRQQLRVRLAAELKPLLAALHEAHKQTRVLETLRDRQREEHRRTQAIREQSEADETARELLERRVRDAQFDAAVDASLESAGPQVEVPATERFAG